LIDAGSPYVENAVNLCKNVKFDLDLVRAIESRVITLGDLVAHTVSVNNLDQIISHYEVLLGRPVLPILESTIDRWAVEVEGNDAAPIIRDVQEVCRQLAALFVTRHISVHEVAARPALNVQDVEGYLKATDDFIAATEWALQDLLYGKTPLTQGAMTAEAWSKFRAADTDLELLLGELRVRIGSDQVRLNLLEESQRAWLAFRDTQAELFADNARGGTLAAQLAGMERESLTRERIKSLQWYMRVDV
jgi:uncharacterized protein YecT (DUF1311 family)